MEPSLPLDQRPHATKPEPCPRADARDSQRWVRRQTGRHVLEFVLGLILLALAILPLLTRAASPATSTPGSSKSGHASSSGTAAKKKSSATLFAPGQRKSTTSSAATPSSSSGAAATAPAKKTRTTRYINADGEISSTTTSTSSPANTSRASQKRSTTASVVSSTSAEAQAAAVKQKIKSRAKSTTEGNAESSGTASTPATATATVSGVSEMRIAVYGDSMANGLGWGLEQLAAKRPGVRIINRGKVSSGLARPDFYDWPTSFSRFLAGDKPDIAVVFLGLNDNQTMWNNGKFTYEFGTSGWEEMYAQRVRDMIALAKANNVKIFWIGLPQVNPPVYSKKVVLMNGIFSQCTSSEGGGYIPIWDWSAPSGAFTAYLQDGGTMKLARSPDGSHFTMRGNMMLGRYVLQQLDQQVPALAERATLAAAPAPH